MATAATVAAATAFTMVVAMIVVVTVTAAAAIVTMIVVVIMTMRAVHVTVLQLFSGRFADGDNFHIELQVLACQHVVAINHNVVVFNFSNLYWYRTLIGFRRKRMPTCSSSTPMKTSFGTRCTGFRHTDRKRR